MRGQKFNIIQLGALGLMLIGCSSEESTQDARQVSVAPTREATRGAEPAIAGGSLSEMYMMSTLDREEETEAETDAEAEEESCGAVDQSCCEQVYCNDERCELMFSCASRYYACRIFTVGGDHTSVCFDTRDCGDLGNHCCVGKVCTEGSCVRGICEQ